MIVDIDALQSIQLRAASGESREHLVALVEFAWDLPIEQAERLVPRIARVDYEKPIRDEETKAVEEDDDADVDEDDTEDDTEDEG